MDTDTSLRSTPSSRANWAVVLKIDPALSFEVFIISSSYVIEPRVRVPSRPMVRDGKDASIDMMFAK